MVKRILFISKGLDSASTRYRALQFFPLFHQAGSEAVHVTAAGNPNNYFHALRLAATSDVVVVLRKTFPNPMLWLLRHLSRKLVFDFDDAIFCNTDGSSSATRMRRFAAMTSVCDHVLAGNFFLADFAKRFNSTVTVVPTCVDTKRYSSERGKSQDFFDIVWIGSSSTKKYLVDALPWIEAATTKIPGLRLKIIADFDLPGYGIPTLPIRWRAETEARELATAHIGIAPMRDDDWSRGKCALKVLQYMAAGLPVLSSNAGANRDVVVEGETGFLVSSPAGWVEQLERLASNATLRQQMGDAGRHRVETEYSFKPVFERLHTVITKLDRE
jgi:glycosyltransferase involved in cell wall biosynthesis